MFFLPCLQTGLEAGWTKHMNRFDQTGGPVRPNTWTAAGLIKYVARGRFDQTRGTVQPNTSQKFEVNKHFFPNVEESGGLIFSLLL